MAENKTSPNNASVAEYIASRATVGQSEDCARLITLLKKITKQAPKMWSPSIVGFACLACAWLYTGAKAYAAIRSRDIVSHRRWMARNFSLTLAAVSLRLWLPGLVVSGVSIQIAFPVVAWLCWVPNLLIAEWLLNKTPKSTMEPKPS